LNLKHFQWKLLYPYVILIIASLIFFGYYTSSKFKDFYISGVAESLSSRTNLIRDMLSMQSNDSININSLADKYDKSSDTRITIVNPSGKVLADSREDISKMENLSSRPEIIDAIKNGSGISIRYDYSLQSDMLFFAVPVFEGNQIKYILRTSAPLNKTDSAVSKIYTTAIIAGIIILLITFTISIGIAANYSKPLAEMRDAAEGYTRGEFEKKIYPPKNGELRRMADSLNTMASQLSERLAIIGEQKNMQQAVFESMKEGVLAIDYDEKILFMNKTAGKILGISNTEVEGRTLQEIVRISEIQKFFKKIIEEGNAEETEIIIQHDVDKVLQLSGTILKDINNKEIGAQVVLNDITNLKHLDTLKKDLIANVSHELKTPVTTIKGFIETLQDGAMDDPKNAERFLEIILKHIDRLNLIIDDILTLSKLEQTDEANNVHLEELSVKQTLESAKNDFEIKAKEKNITINVNCDENLTANLDSYMIGQALSNLIDNAIKYSDKDTSIEIAARKENGQLVINVEDEGFGIADEHIPRLFERFYRVDKSRSRDIGGTGLGLAIVKHIVNALGGTIEVESIPGKGSNFIMKIPGK